MVIRDVNGNNNYYRSLVYKNVLVKLYKYVKVGSL